MQPPVGADGVQRAGGAFVAGGAGELQPYDLRAKARLQLAGGAAGDDAAAVEHGDGVGELVRLLEVLRGEQDRDTLVGQAADGAPQLLAAAQVETGRRFVEEQQPRSLDHAHREIEAASHAAGIGRGPPVAGGTQVEGVEHLTGAYLRLSPGKVPEPGHHGEVLLPGQLVVDGGVLAGEADRALHAGRVGQQVVAGDRGGACIGAYQGGQDAYQRGLASAVRA